MKCQICGEKEAKAFYKTIEVCKECYMKQKKKKVEHNKAKLLERLKNVLSKEE